MAVVMERIVFYMQHHTEGKLRTEAVLFSSVFGVLGESKGAAGMAEYFGKQMDS